MLNVLKNVIRVGRVSSVNPEKATARVTFEAQEVVSYNLPVLQNRAFNDKDYCLPDVGEYVVCVFLPTGNAEGFVLGSIYPDSVVPPAVDQNKRVVSFSDGTTIEYDKQTHTLTVNAVGTINISAPNGVQITGKDRSESW